MSMNIKSEHAHKLALELAELTGETVTAAVTHALQERLERVRRSRGRKTTNLVELIGEIGKDCAYHLKEPYFSGDHGDLLYNDKGLPK